MTSSEGANSASRPTRGKKGQRQNSPIPHKNSSAPEKDDDPVLQSIASKPSVLQNQQVTLTCYIPSQSIGAVIGRRGSTIAQIQRHAQQYGSLSASIVGHDDTSESVPYTFTALDWTCKDWTPVVIRGDPCAALCAAKRLRDAAGGDLDDVILDIPLNRGKFSTLLGKKGSVLFNLSADTNVRIMVPQRALRINLIQLEGELDNVKLSFEKIVDLLSSLKKRTPGEGENTVSASLQVPSLPSQSKLRVVAKKTETNIQKKRQDDETWMITVWGQDMEHVESAIEMLSKKPSQQAGSTTSTQRRSRGSQGRRPKSAKKGSSGGRGGGAASATTAGTSPPPAAAATSTSAAAVSPDASNTDN